MTNARRIEVLAIDGCPHADLAVERAREAAGAEGFTGEIVSIVVDGAEDAAVRRFLGSPSVRVDGVDVDDSSSPDAGYGLRCRLYAHDGRIEGAPAVERIVAALRADFSGIASALAPAFPAGSETLFVALVGLLAEGVPVSRARLAEKLGWSNEQVARILAQIPNVEYDDETIVGAALSIRETPHVFEVDGRTLYTWCALDALFLPALLGKTCRVASPCAATGRLVRLEVGPDAAREIEPSDAAVSVVFGACGSDLRRSFCDNVRFFVSRAAARDWMGAREGTILSVPDGFRLGAAIARHLGWRSAGPAQASPIFACSLPPAELRRRRVEVLARLRGMVRRIEETADGVVFTFDRSPGLREELEELVRFEAACCPFIAMTLSDAQDGAVDLRMSAPEEARSFIHAEFVDVARGTTTSTSCGCT